MQKWAANSKKLKENRKPAAKTLSLRWVTLSANLSLIETDIAVRKDVPVCLNYAIIPIFLLRSFSPLLCTVSVSKKIC